MTMALEEAVKAAALGEVPVGAVVVMGDLAMGAHNRTIMDADPTAHAEVVVLREAARRVKNHRLVGSTLYVTVEPCLMCVGAIVQARVSRLVIGAADPRYGAVESMVRGFDLGVNHRPQVVTGVLEQECSEIIKDFFSRRRRGEVPKWS